MIDLLLEFLAAFGTSVGDAGFNAAVDFNGDGHITVYDLFDLLANYSDEIKSSSHVRS